MSEPIGEVKKSMSTQARRVVAYIVLTFLCLLCLFWFYVLFVYASRSHGEISTGLSMLPSKYLGKNFMSVFNDATNPIVKGLLNSFIIAGLNACVGVYFSTLTAYAIHAYDFKGKKIIFTLILMIMMIPTQVTVLGFLTWIDTLREVNKNIWANAKDWSFVSESVYKTIRKIAKGGTYADYVWLIIPSMASPVTFYYLKQYMDGALPHALIEAARIDGSSEVKTFNTIALPLMKPAISVQAIFSFVGTWNNFFVPARVLADVDPGVKTVPIMLEQIRNTDYLNKDQGKIYMCIALSILPVVVVYFALSRYIVGGLAVGSVKG